MIELAFHFVTYSFLSFGVAFIGVIWLGVICGSIELLFSTIDKERNNKND